MKKIQINRRTPHVRMISEPRSVERVQRRPTQFGVIELHNGETHIATCLHCPDSPCVCFHDDEISAPVGIDATYYPSSLTCIYDAIKWDSGQQIPIVDTDACTGCGICIGRCPVGALRLSDAGTAELNNEPNVLFQVVDNVPREEFNEHRALLRDAARRDCDSIETTFLVARLPTVIKSLGRIPLGPRLSYGLLVRNYLLTLGLPARTSNPGDTNYRADLTFANDKRIGIAELDLGDGLLDAVRRLLANYSITHARFDVAQADISACIFYAELPNGRADVYELFGDIRTVLEIDIHVVPIALLMLLVSYGADYQRYEVNNFLLNREKKEVRSDISKIFNACTPDLQSVFFEAVK